MARRSLILMAYVAVVGLALFGLPSFSSATFSTVSSNVASVTAANDWTAPTVSVRNPGAIVGGTVVITADAADARSAVAGVTIQYLAPDAGSWTTLCTATTTPYSCSWNTRNGADGDYALRAVATDTAGYATTSETVSTTVANTFSIVLGNPGDVVRGNVTLSATLHNNLLPYVVRIEYAVAGTGTWRTLCGNLVAAPYSCTWNTASTTFVQGESYDLRAVATNGLVSTTSAVVSDVMIDNVAPTVTMADPGTPLRGTATFAATAADADAGIAQVQLQYQRSGTSTWTTFCTPTAEPYSCRYNTTQLTDGTYSFRAVATDAIGNTSTSATVANRVVDNTVATVSVEDPGAYLSGSVTVTASASSTAGITSVRIDRAPSGSTTWSALCTDSSAPYSCTWDTTAVADGLYDLRAVMTDSQGRTTTSTIVSARRVDNSPLRGYDVQATNGGASAGKLGQGDVLKLTYTDQVNPGSISTGWTGGSLAVVVRLRDALSVGSSGNNDTVDVLRNGSTLPLGSINLKQNFIKNNKQAQFAATMVASTTTVDGTTATVLTITVGALTSGGSLRTATAATAVWTPSATALDLQGRPCSTAPVSERGALDRDF
ncbi:signal peptidase I [Nocardioides silvaticus]|uniref:Signal peptidase I n=1 Tax=Nocardioides silvaticus TaxID=2201891 RepID=A0A316TEU2_9ACTN|nr:Ig-like domain-containing protein [Nocardioides silvaticus]PWN03023.1 signal peptidase I [Nocardioides silvaticus]